MLQNTKFLPFVGHVKGFLALLLPLVDAAASVLDDMLLGSEENMVLGCYHECITKYAV